MDRLSTDIALQKKISFSWGVRTPDIAGNITVLDALEEIKNCKFASKITQLRALEKGSEEQDNLKQSLKTYIFGGVFLTRKAIDLEEYSNLCVLDIDNLNTERLEAIKALFDTDPYVLAYWTSPRGEGLKGVIMFEYYPPLEPTQFINAHKNAFEAFKDYLQKNYNIELDDGKEVNRPCFTTSDSELVIKEYFIPFPINSQEIIHEEKAKNPRNSRAKTKSITSKDESSVENIQRPYFADKRRKMNSVLKFLEKRKLSITSTYKKWYLVGQAIANEFSYNVGKKYYLKLCELDKEKHDEHKSILKLIECYQNELIEQDRLTIGTIVYFAKEYGYNTEETISSSDTED